MTFRNLAKLYLADCKPRHKATTYSSESYHIYEEATTHFFDVRQPLFAWHRSRIILKNVLHERTMENPILKSVVRSS